MQEKAREEISNVITDVEELSMEQLNSLLYTDAFIKESLRLFIPVPQNGRVPTKDCKFGNVSIPKGTTLLIPNLYIHKNEFEKGEEFIPERWLNGMFYFFTAELNYNVFCKYASTFPHPSKFFTQRS